MQTTGGIAPAARLNFWQGSVLRRLEPIVVRDAPAPFQVRMCRIEGAGTGLVEHASAPITALRTAERCRRDSCDDISIDFMLRGTGAVMEHGGTHRLRAGDLRILDYAQPIAVARPLHRAIGVVLPRARVAEALGADPAGLAGRCLPGTGIGALLGLHLRLTMEEAPNLSPGARQAAVTAATEMALAVLQAEFRGMMEAEAFGVGVYRAALGVIARDCGDSHLAPDWVARVLGCSRASLYRVFARHGESVAAVIQSVRRDRARGMLASEGYPDLPAAEIAFRRGFVEQSGFNRMFKRRFGVTPGEVRVLNDFPTELSPRLADVAHEENPVVGRR